MQVRAGEMLSVMKVSISLWGWDIKEEEEQKIFLAINQSSLEPVREKDSGVWEDEEQHYGGGQAFRITGHSQHLQAPLLCRANSVPLHWP